MTHETPAALRPRGRAGLFTPFVILLIVLLGWTGWWLYLSRQVESRLEAGVEQMQAAGWRVGYSGLSTTGWPFRARLSADHVSLQAPSGHALAGPSLVAETVAWNPDRWVILAPQGLTVTRAGKGKVNIRATAIRASVSGLRQRYKNVAVELARPVFTAHPGAEPFPIASAERVEFYLRPHLAPATTDATGAQVGASGDAADVLFRLVDARGRPGGPVEGMVRDGRLTAQLETVVEKADRFSGANVAGVFSAWTAAGGRFVDTRGEMRTGDSRATLSSAELRADADGRLVGQVALKAVQPLPVLAGLARSPSVATGNKLGAAGAAAATAVSAPGGGDIDLTILFRDGRTFLGPFALAPAPKLF